MTEREAFEAWYGDIFMSGMDDAGEFDQERNCYVTFQVHMAYQGYMAGRKQMAEEAAAVVAPWRNAQHLKLHAGECTAQEVRTVKAVLFAIDGRIRALATPTKGKT